MCCATLAGQSLSIHMYSLLKGQLLSMCCSHVTQLAQLCCMSRLCSAEASPPRKGRVCCCGSHCQGCSCSPAAATCSAGRLLTVADHAVACARWVMQFCMWPYAGTCHNLQLGHAPGVRLQRVHPLREAAASMRVSRRLIMPPALFDVHHHLHATAAYAAMRPATKAHAWAHEVCKYRQATPTCNSRRNSRSRRHSATAQQQGDDANGLVVAVVRRPWDGDNAGGAAAPARPR